MEADGETVIADGDAAKVLEAIEHALDGVPAFVEIWGKAVLPDAGDLGRNVGSRVLCFDFLAHGVGVVSLVAVDKFSCADFIEQGTSGDTIWPLAAREKKSDCRAPSDGRRPRWYEGSSV